MNRITKIQVVLLTALLLGVSLPVAAWAMPAPRYSFQTIDVPGIIPGVDGTTQIVWINNRGMLTVQYQQPLDADWFVNMHTATVENGVWTVIDVPGAATTGPANANSSGAVALNYSVTYPGGAFWQWAMYRRGRYVQMPDLPGGQFLVGAINDHGMFAAQGLDGSTLIGTSTDYVIFKDLEITWPFAINNAGMVVGQTIDPAAGVAYAFTYDIRTQTYSRLDTPEFIGPMTFGTAINNRGDIAGNYWDGVAGHAFLRRNGVFTTFDVPGALVTVPYSINDRGQIAGSYLDAGSIWHGFVATPVHGQK